MHERPGVLSSMAPGSITVSLKFLLFSALYGVGLFCSFHLRGIVSSYLWLWGGGNSFFWWKELGRKNTLLGSFCPFLVLGGPLLSGGRRVGVGWAVDASTNGVVRLVENRFNGLDCSRHEELDGNIDGSVQRSAFRQTTIFGESALSTWVSVRSWNNAWSGIRGAGVLAVLCCIRFCRVRWAVVARVDAAAWMSGQRRIMDLSSRKAWTELVDDESERKLLKSEESYRNK